MDIRIAALKKCYSMEGYADLPLTEKNKIYDSVKAELEKKKSPTT
jgi:hypothetical protein